MFLKCLVSLIFFGFISADYHSYERCPYPHLMHGIARVKQRLNFVKFSCRARYTLMGNKYATCRGGSWDLPTPICIKAGCDPLPEVKNAVTQSNHNNSWVLFFCFPGHNLIGSPVLYCDGRVWNSTVPQCVDSSAQPKTSCDFENPDLCGWKQDELHDFDWRRLNKRTPSSFLLTGPQYDHTFGRDGNGYYMYIESTSRATNDTARLISPVMDEQLAKNGCFAFYYHMYGRHIGGLRVYQKPDKLSMYDLLHYSDANGKNKYILFEQWGNQGNIWFTSVSPLLDVSDDFQIVIEGIRGRSFMSDIAIDDVAILQGENCTVLTNDATTPLSTSEDSCVGRCGVQNGPSSSSCDCTIICVVSDNCCPDYLDVCEFGINNNGSDEIESSTLTSYSIQLPQTQKLVATTTSSVPTTTSRSTTPSTTTSTSTSTSTTSTSTTRRPTTTSTTQRPRSTYRTTTTTKLTTTTTTPKPRTIRTTTEATNAKNRSSPATFNKSRTTVVYTVKPAATQRTYFDFTVKAPLPPKRIVSKKPQGASGVTIAVVVVLVIGLCSGLVYGGYVLRTARGTSALARLRGRTTRDPEVRFLKADVDIDDDE